MIVGHDEVTREPIYEAIGAIVEEELEDGNLYDCVEKEYYFKYAIIKGIGTTHWGLFRDRYLMYSTTTSTVIKFIRGGVTIFAQKELPSMVSTPDCISHLSVSKPSTSSAFYDMHGKAVTKPRHGVYIQNGRKHVLR